MAFFFSRPASISLWYGRMTWALSLTTSWAGSASSDLLLSRSISSIKASGSTTTPLPMKHFLPECSTPDGTRCSTVFTPPTTSVCPALAPPWKRTTTSAHEVKRSTIFPLPSSPHWAPTMTTFDMRSKSLSRRRAAAVHAVAGDGELGVILAAFDLQLAVLEDGRGESAVHHQLAAAHHARGLSGQLSHL